jgi:hypothetical protein
MTSRISAEETLFTFLSILGWLGGGGIAAGPGPADGHNAAHQHNRQRSALQGAPADTIGRA